MIIKKKIKLILLSLLSIFFTLFMILLTNYKENGIIEINKLQAKLDLLNKETKDLKKTNIKLEKLIYYFKNNPLYIEKIAREKLGLIKEGETIFEFINN